jgi:hypothetical protein
MKVPKFCISKIHVNFVGSEGIPGIHSFCISVFLGKLNGQAMDRRGRGKWIK